MEADEKMKVLDLFCGAGGFSEGFKQAGFEIALGVDIWNTALKSFKMNHDAEVLKADLSQRGIEKSFSRGEFDVIIGGPPCQRISIARLGNPYLNEKGYNPDYYLCYRFLEIVNQLKPKFWVMENVKQLKREFQRAVLLNAKDFGVPQNRIRAFFSNFTLPYLIAKVDWQRWKPYPTVCGNDGFNFKTQIQIIKNGFDKYIFPTACGDHGFYRKRRVGFEPTNEFLAWVQGFPNEYKFYGNKKEVRKQIVNAVPPPLARAIAHQLLEVSNSR